MSSAHGTSTLNLTATSLTTTSLGTPVPSTRVSSAPSPSSRILKDTADRRALFWAFVLFPAPAFIAWSFPSSALILAPLALYTGFCAGVLTHYHNHRPVFVRARANTRYSLWLSVFYGFPIWSWIPTHNQNHHKHVNGPGDATRTTRTGKSDSLWQLLSYPTRSSAWQAPGLLRYLGELRLSNPARHRQALVQAAIVPLAHGALLVAFVSAHGAIGVLGYFCTLGLPALVAPWSMMFINYLQHVGCDPHSPDDHSRNFVGSWENWLVFDAGLHTVHHEHPGTHWSRYRELHQARAARIHPSLNEQNVLSFVVKRYVRRDRSFAPLLSRPPQNTPSSSMSAISSVPACS